MQPAGGALEAPAHGDDELVTVVIPALNEADNIDATLRAVRDQSYQTLQIVVIDGGSRDRTAAIVEEHAQLDPRIELVSNRAGTIPHSLNLGLARAKGRWLVRVDAHSVVDRGYVRTIVTELQSGEWGGVGGRKDGIGRTAAGRAIAAAMGSRFGVGGSTYHHGQRRLVVDHIPFGGYPTSLVRQLGGWNESLVANEDYEFDYRLRRAGFRLCFDPAIKIDWLCRQSIGDLWRQYKRYGSGKLDVVMLHPSSVSPRHLAPPALVAHLAGAIVTLLVSRRRKWAAVSLLPYATALSIASVRTARTLEDRAARSAVPLAYLAMHVGWGVGFWTRLAEKSVAGVIQRPPRLSRKDGE